MKLGTWPRMLDKIPELIRFRLIPCIPVIAGEAVQADFGIRSVPVMFVIDKKGKVAEVFRGYSDEIGRSMDQLIKRLLSEK